MDKQPNLPAAYYFLGITHDELGEYMDAMANYQQFLRLADPAASKLEIEKVNLRLPDAAKTAKGRKGKKGMANPECPRQPSQKSSTGAPLGDP